MTKQDDLVIAEGFKLAMRRLATTVSIVTTGQSGRWAGMAATAVVPICAEPPTMMVAVNQSASSHTAIREGEYFCINLLATRHRELVSVFGGKVAADLRFAHGQWIEGTGGVPVLADSLASLTCAHSRAVSFGTHTLFFGEVVDIANHADIDPLLWMDGGVATGIRTEIV